MPHQPPTRPTAAALILPALLLLTIACASQLTPTPVPTLAAAPTHTPTLAPTHTPTPTAAPTPTSMPTPTAAPTPLISFPVDEGPHDAPIEWWYFNGILQDSDGQEYSYHFVAFQAPGPPGVTPRLLQATLADHQQGIHHTAERGILAPAQPPAADPGIAIDIAAGSWLLRGGPHGYQLRFALDADAGTPAPALELRAIPQRPPVLHGGAGLVNMGPEAGATYYYSRTRLEVTGWIQQGKNRRPVHGPGWMDHQWGEITPQSVGWDWASIQLNDGADLMAAVVWRTQPDGQKRRLSAHATYITPDGAATYLHGDDLTITPQSQWRSPATGVTYPIGWRLDAAPLNLSLQLTPRLKHAEFNSEILGAAYWEGAVSAAGHRRGQPVTGWGFVELAGYDPRRPQITIPPTP